MGLGPGARVAGYEIEAVVATGGMGVVYAARDLRLGRSVALKVIRPDLAGNARLRRRFLLESQAAAAIDHPNVLPVYEAGEAGRVLFIATRLVDGQDLGEVITREGQLAPQRAVGIVAQVAAALDMAHAHGLVHRDVKPANVLLTSTGRHGGEHSYLTDFGITKRIGGQAELTNPDQFVGTLAYVAPEEVKGAEIDGRADVYSLGCLAYECLTGHVPYRRDSDVAMMWAHANDAPPAAGDHGAPVPAEIDEAIKIALSKERDERFSSCGAFAHALRQGVGLEGPEAPGPIEPWARLARVEETTPVDGTPAPASLPAASTVAPGSPAQASSGRGLAVGIGLFGLLTAFAIIALSLVAKGGGGTTQQDASAFLAEAQAIGASLSDVIRDLRDLEGTVDRRTVGQLRSIENDAASLAESAPGALDDVRRQQADAVTRFVGTMETVASEAIDAARDDPESRGETLEGLLARVDESQADLEAALEVENTSGEPTSTLGLITPTEVDGVAIGSAPGGAGHLIGAELRPGMLSDACAQEWSADHNASIIFQDDRFASFSTEGEELATAEGISVGDSIEALTSAYPSAVEQENDLDYYVWSGESGLRFFAEGDRVRGIAAGKRQPLREGCA